MIIVVFKEVLATKFCIIWLHKSVNTWDKYSNLNDISQNDVPSIITNSTDVIHDVLRILATYATPITHAETPQQALMLIDQHKDKRIFFISSASLAKSIIPIIIAEQDYDCKFYILCHDISYWIDWAIDYTDYVQMFDFEIDLLIRISTEISTEIINLGRSFMASKDSTNAIKCFKNARQILILVTARTDAHFLHNKHIIKMLDGDENNVGLFQQACQMNQQQQKVFVTNIKQKESSTKITALDVLNRAVYDLSCTSQSQ
jgi:hypothetical protein